MEEDQLQGWQTQWMLSTNEEVKKAVIIAAEVAFELETSEALINTQIVNNKGKYFQIQLLIGHKLTCATQRKYFGPFNYTFWSSLAKNKLILEIIGVE